MSVAHETGLTDDEVRRAYELGRARTRTVRNEYFTWKPDDGDHAHMDGQAAVAEARVARYLGRDWIADGDGPDNPALGDVDGLISVRWTERPNGCLVFRHADPEHLAAVLVVGPYLEQRLVGWLPVADGKVQRYWRDDVPYPAFFVPQSDLRPMSELPALLDPPSSPAPSEPGDLREVMARAMRAQGKVDPDEVFAEADDTDPDDPRYRGDTDAEWMPPSDQETLPLEGEDRGYAYEP